MKLFATVGLMGLVLTQGPGNGVSKDTRACSEGIIESTFRFMMKYFPVIEAPDDCPRAKCECGTQARVQLDSSASSFNRTATERRRQVLTGFGLHCVYAAGLNGEREKESGSMTQEELEAVFVKKFGDMSKFDRFMFYGTGLYTANARSFTEKLDSNNVPYFTYKWASGSRNYVSLLVTPPNTQMMYEIVSPALSAPRSLLEKAVEQESPSFSFNYFGEFEEPEVGAGEMSALFVSRATTDIARDQKYFETVFGLSESNFVTYTGTDPNGESYKTLEVQMSARYTTKYRLVQPANITDGEYSVKWWEDYQNGVNAKYMKSPTCGWPVLGDNHNAFDWQLGFDQRNMVAGMKKLGMPYFCSSDQMGTHCYVTTPYGYQIQLDGTYRDPPTYYEYSHNLCATYNEHC